MRPKIICKICKEKKEHQAHGKCGKCYRKDYREKHKERIKEVRHQWYERNKEKVITNTKKWMRENPEKRRINKKRSNKKYYKTDKRKKVLQKSYHKHKSKNFSRGTTYQVIHGKNGYKPLGLPKEWFNCKVCGNTKTEIHHEVYPRGKVEIIKAINEGKIYCLCNRCHNNTHGKIACLPSKENQNE